MSKGKEWFEQRYIHDLAKKEDIAKELGCSIHNVSRLARVYGLKRGRAIQIGKKPWNYGLTKNDDPRVMSVSKKQSGENNPMFGKDSWNKGKTKETNETMMIISAKNTGRVMSKESVEKIKASRVGRVGERAANYKRGWWLNGDGYVEIKIDGRKIYLHRHIAENSAKRKLGRFESVHHVDGDKQNNSCGNLLIISLSSHTALHKFCFPASKEQQIEWLKDNGHLVEEVADNEDN